MDMQSSGHWSGTHRGSEREEDPTTPGDVLEWQSSGPETNGSQLATD